MLDSNRIVWTFKMSIDVNAVVAITRLIPEVIIRTAIEQTLRDGARMFRSVDWTPRGYSKLGNKTFPSEKALPHLAIWRKYHQDQIRQDSIQVDP